MSMRSVALKYDNCYPCFLIQSPDPYLHFISGLYLTNDISRIIGQVNAGRFMQE